MKNPAIGTSGYVYQHWKKIFYPEKLSPSKWFEFYTEHFSTVELNVSFYRLPPKSAFQGWHRRSPENFSFFVKGSRYITHIKKLKDCGEALDRFFSAAFALEEKLAGFLWQMPPRFKKNTERLKYFLDELGRFPPSRHVFEFRDESWFDGEIEELLRKYGAIHCRADRRDYYERIDIPDTADFVYIRRHGLPNRNRYNERELQKDAEEITGWLRQHKQVFIYFNNDIHGDALDNAKKLEQLLAASASIRQPQKGRHARAA